jgi:hypothetical protein
MAITAIRLITVDELKRLCDTGGLILRGGNLQEWAGGFNLPEALIWQTM